MTELLTYRKILLYVAAATVAWHGCKPGTGPGEHRRPNVLLMLADDMGYSDLGCYGGVSATPSLNNLASQGLRFTDFYAAAPNCSPSRTGLLTGRNPALVGMYNYRPPGHPMHLRDEEVTLAEVLKDQGYATAHIGKWHLGCLPQDTTLNHPQPGEQGFDYSFGTENNAQPSHKNPVNFVRNGTSVGVQEGYSCHILAEEVKYWLEAHHDRNRPFFIYLAFHEPHKKVASPPELVAKYASRPPADAEYLANIENLDRAVGRVIAMLKEKALFDNTLIMFTSDNGSYRQRSNEPLRAVKSHVYDGGIRVPGIMCWTGIAHPGRLVGQPAGFVDIMPTVCNLLGVVPETSGPLEGTSLAPLFKGDSIVRKQPLYWFFYRTSPEIAMRMGRYMVLGKDRDTVLMSHRFSRPDMAYVKSMQLADYELYDLSTDVGQFDNIIDVHPEADRYKATLRQQLEHIQANGYTWDHLPERTGAMKFKAEWRPYTMPNR